MVISDFTVTFTVLVVQILAGVIAASIIGRVVCVRLPRTRVLRLHQLQSFQTLD